MPQSWFRIRRHRQKTANEVRKAKKKYPRVVKNTNVINSNFYYEGVRACACLACLCRCSMTWFIYDRFIFNRKGDTDDTPQSGAHC